MKAVSFGRSRGTRRRSKYGNVRTNGFASKHEYAIYKFLEMRQKAGQINGLKCQVPYPLKVNGVLICTYVADFSYHEIDGNTSTHTLADAKGYPTREYRLKKKLMKAIHGIDIQEL